MEYGVQGGGGQRLSSKGNSYGLVYPNEAYWLGFGQRVGLCYNSIAQLGV